MVSETKKFKVGDRVRRLEQSDWPDQYGVVGKEYTVLAVSCSGGITVIDGEEGADYRCFELVTPKWEPKVGDRVRITKHCNYNGDKIDMEAPIGSIQVIEKLSDQLYDYGLQAFSLRGFKRHIYSMLNVETLTAPSALTISAGKFYKTRDGRKVGPMVWNTTVDGWIVKIGDGSAWGGDGKARLLALINQDLVAEWVDEPVAPTKPKFKVGDKVRGVINPIDYIILAVKPNGNVDVRAANSWCQYHDQDPQDFTPIQTPTAIVALIENGAPKPSSRPYVHLSQEAATTEAERLALLHAGQEFGVFVLADSKIADVVEETVKRTVLRAA